MQAFISRTCLLSLLAGFFMAAAIPAEASEFGDCNDPAYLALFDARLARDTGFLCVEGGRTPVRSDAGVTHTSGTGIAVPIC